MRHKCYSYKPNFKKRFTTQEHLVRERLHRDLGIHTRGLSSLFIGAMLASGPLKLCFPASEGDRSERYETCDVMLNATLINRDLRPAKRQHNIILLLRRLSKLNTKVREVSRGQVRGTYIKPVHYISK